MKTLGKGFGVPEQNTAEILWIPTVYEQCPVAQLLRKSLLLCKLWCLDKAE